MPASGVIAREHIGNSTLETASTTSIMGFSAALPTIARRKAFLEALERNKPAR